MYHKTPARFTVLEDEGLQVNFAKDHGPEVVKPDHEGLQAAPINEDSLKETYTTSPMYTTKADPKGLPTVKRSKLKLWILAAVIGFIALLAIILGAVLGTRASQSTSPATQPSATAAASSQDGGTSGASARVRSTSGAWNGTGLASVYAHNAYFWSWMFYQDYTGSLIAGQYNLSSNGSAFMVGKPAVTTASGKVKAVGGTGLAATHYWSKDATKGTYVDKWQLVYVAPNGTMCDLWLQGGDIDTSGRITGVWKEGALSEHNFQAPTDSRPAFFMASSEVWYGDVYNNSNNAARLWAGGADGKLHQYSWKGDGGEWSDQSYTFPDSYAYGAAYAMAAEYDGAFNTTLYTTAADGTLQYRVQSNSGQVQWPVGGTWADPVTTGAKASVNSSVAAQWENAWGSYVYYPTDQSKMGAYELALDQSSLKQWKQYDPEFEALKIMPGSDMTHDGNSHGSLVHFQQDGNDISWQYFANGAGIRGRLDVS